MSNFNRKLNKLKRDPTLFFMDMKKNYITKKKNNLPISGCFYYTVISAVYNVDKYLDDYFNSLVKQSISFEKHIQLILVDDGSTDNSAKIIKKWQSKYPKNITYIYKENGGQGSARNEGLQHVKTEWVTFVDPDDFLDKDYFLEIDRFLTRNKYNDIKMIGCSLVFYLEKNKEFRDNHPLKYRFSKSGTLFPYDDLQENMQLSASTAFFKFDEIKRNNIIFNPRVKPNFEDATFIAFYMAGLISGKISFLGSAKYYYRKRGDGSSTLDTSWEKTGLFTDVLEFGCLQSLINYKEKLGAIPKYYQRAVLYHLIWYFKRIINNQSSVSFLTEPQKNKFRNLLFETFEHIENDTILSFGLAGCWFFHKVGLLHYYKKEKPNFQIAYIEDYDINKNQVLIYYFSGDKFGHSFTVNNEDTIPVYEKSRTHDFLGEVFVYEHRCWISIGELNSSKGQLLQLKINGIESRLSLAGRQYQKGINTATIKQHFVSKRHTFSDTNIQYQDCWILMDRDIQADDNAEHLYRYILNHHSEKNAYFVLRKDSHDWNRLFKEGFKLLAFGSKEHEQALRSCSKIISSHADVYVTNYFRDNKLLDKDFVFLQHGITKDDMSDWFNTKKIAKLITASGDEYQSIVSSGSSYKFTAKEIVLTGFPRHDRLLAGNDKSTNKILIMPTWRQSIVGKVSGSGNSREFNPDFMKSNFAQRWNQFLHSKRLQDLVETFNRELVFFPHANIQPYLKQFDLPPYIKVLSHHELSIQQLFQKSEILITDYSSVAFEMAYLNKPVLYYHFDYDDVYSGGHTYSKGYFDYRRDAFGPVVEKEIDLLNELEILLGNDGRANCEHQSRMNAFFPYKDGKCCQRTYNAILEIDQPESPDYSYKQLLQYADSAIRSGDWDVALSRWQKVIKKRPDDIYSKLQISEVLIHTGQVLEAKSILESCSEVITAEHETNFLTQLASIYLLQDRWDKCEQIWGKLLEKSKPSIQQMLGYLQILAEQGKVDQLNECIIKCYSQQISDLEGAMIRAIVSWGDNDTYQAIEVLTAAVTDITDRKILKVYKPQLLLAKLLRLSGVYDAAHSYLVDYEKHTSNDPYCRLEIARLSAAQNNFDKVVNQLIQAFPEGITAMSPSHALMYLSSVRKIGNVQKALSEIESFEATGNSTHYEIAVEKAILLMELKDWVAAAEVLTSIEGVDSRYHYLLAKCYRMMGLLDQALELVLCRNSVNPSNSEEWLLRAELAQLKQRWDIATESWGEHLRLYPDQSPGWVWERYQSTQLLNNIVSSSTKAS